MKKNTPKHFISETDTDTGNFGYLKSLIGENNSRQLYRHFQDNKILKCNMQLDASEILTLAELQEIINTRRLSFPRCRLVRSGKPLPPGDYNERKQAVLGESITKLVTNKVMHHLNSGATLAIDFAEDLSLKIKSIGDAISHQFLERTGATIFFSMGDEKGFTTHWDNSDVLVFQLSGKKRWKIYHPTLESPVEENKAEMSIPEGQPSDDFILNSNEMLYIPRGYWHAPEPCGAHSLHISFAFRKRNGIDFMKWLIPTLPEHLCFREDIKKTATSSSKESYIQKLRSELDNLITVEYLDAFIAASNQRQLARDIIDFGQCNK